MKETRVWKDRGRVDGSGRDEKSSGEDSEKALSGYPHTNVDEANHQHSLTRQPSGMVTANSRRPCRERTDQTRPSIAADSSWWTSLAATVSRTCGAP